MYENILFDLDGTLTDPGEGITNSVIYALSKWNISVEQRSTLYKFIGPPLKDSFINYYAFSQEQAKEAVDYYREYFRNRGIFENKVYIGIEELLKTLKSKGKKIVLATSKPEEFAVAILEHFGLNEYFDFIAGADMSGDRSKKGEVIAYALVKARIRDINSTIMIGDREHDIIGARENGLDSIGVLYGYGNREEFIKAEATYIAETVDDILTFL